jgi:hypothetical protein
MRGILVARMEMLVAGLVAFGGIRVLVVMQLRTGSVHFTSADHNTGQSDPRHLYYWFCYLRHENQVRYSVAIFSLHCRIT